MPLAATFIPSTVSDNRFTNDGYKAVLQRLSGWHRRAWLDGDWDVAAGQYFSSFHSPIHTFQALDTSRVAFWTAALDYGFAHFTVVLLAAHGNEGQIWVTAEYAARKRLPEENAAEIHWMLARHGLIPSHLRRFVAGADVFSRESSGECVASQYARQGIRLSRATTDRISGWAAVLSLLGDTDRGIPPRLFISTRCPMLLAQLPALQHDPDKPEDVLKVDCDDEGRGGDDAADALRYLIASTAKSAGATTA